MDRTCDCCGEEIGSYKCSRCSKAWYCSKSCQEASWYRHKFNCDPTNVTTADYLYLACIRDVMPTDYQTLQDYGFHRANAHDKQTMLAGLYQGMTRIGEVKASTLNRWRKQGTLVQEIKKFYENIPAAGRGGYYPWFLKNQWVLDGKVLKEQRDSEYDQNLPPGMVKLGWRIIGGSADTSLSEILRTVSGWEESKEICFYFSSVVTLDIPPDINNRLYVPFGFCTCEDVGDEIDLIREYVQLVKKCTFDEFVDAFKSSRIHDLFHSKNVTYSKQTHPLLEGVLSASPGKIPPVWYMKQFVLKDPEGGSYPGRFTLPNRLDVTIDYGFRNCKNKADFDSLKGTYKTFFDNPNINHKTLELHDACVKGKLFEYLSGVMNIGKNFNLKQLMQNPYPIHDGADPHTSLLDGSDNCSATHPAQRLDGLE